MNRETTSRKIWLMTPATATFTLFFVAPLAYFVMLSFWRVRAYEPVPDATLDNYAKVFSAYGHSLLFTFAVAFSIALLVTVLAFVFGYVCRFKVGRFGSALLFAALITLFGGYLTKIYVWKTILGSNGVLNSALQSIGITHHPIAAFLYNPIAVVITLVHYTLPLAILPTYGALRSVEDVPLECARDLGASKARVYWDIIVPQCRGGILFAFAMPFLIVAGDYVTPRLVGGPYTSMIGVFIESQFGLRVNAPLASAMAVSIILICVVVIGLMAAALWRALRPR
jgi:spermidine/putrescine transport system permease protein